MKLSAKYRWTIALILAIFTVVIIIGLINPPQIHVWLHKPMEVSDPEIFKSLIGVWQDTNIMAAGWSDAFQFFPDGRFVFNHSQMDCTKREIRYAGNWKVNKGILILLVTEREKVEGGNIVDDVICGSTIEGGHDVQLTVNPPDTYHYALNDLRLDRSVDRFGQPYQFLTIRINGIQYWKFRDDPNKYD